MQPKEKKSRLELSDLITDEIKRHPEWSNVRGIAIVPHAQFAPHHPNWDASYIMDGPNVRPAEIVRFVTTLQNKFDCIWPPLP